MTLSPDDGWTVARRGETYLSMKRYEEALADLTKAIKLDPQDAWYYGYRGRTYRDIGSPDHAEVDFVRAREIDPNQDWSNPDSSLTIGEA